MSADSTEREVFEEIDPDPDAILAEFGVESPDDLLEADAGAHDATPDEELSVDDTTAAELFAGLEDLEAADESDPNEDETREDDLHFEFVGDSAVVVRDDGDVIDATASELTALTATESTVDEAGDATERSESGDEVGESGDATEAESDDAAGSSRTLTIRADTADGLELVGPEPTSRRLPDETFGDAR